MKITKRKINKVKKCKLLKVGDLVINPQYWFYRAKLGRPRKEVVFSDNEKTIDAMPQWCGVEKVVCIKGKNVKTTKLCGWNVQKDYYWASMSEYKKIKELQIEEYII